MTKRTLAQGTCLIGVGLSKISFSSYLFSIFWSNLLHIVHVIKGIELKVCKDLVAMNISYNLLRAGSYTTHTGDSSSCKMV